MITLMGNSGVSVLGRDADVYSSGVSWGAVIGGAFVSAALSLILLALGAGFGLAAVSPWSATGATITEVEIGGLVWLIVMAAVSSSMGGWLAGRLRTRWTSIHTDEVHFRDTANGFLVWAVALVITASFLTTAAVAMVGRETAAQGAANATHRHAYFVDRLFRGEHPAAVDAAVQAEAERIFAAVLRHNDGAADDTAYLARLVSAKTGMSEAEAQKRVTDTINDARQMEDMVRKNAARILLWTFLALLIGAFCASFAATIGGRQRDRVRTA